MLMASLLTVVVSVGVTVDMSFRIDEINNSKATQNRNISLNQQKTTDYKFNLSAKGLGFIEAHNDKGNFKK